MYNNYEFLEDTDNETTSILAFVCVRQNLEWPSINTQQVHVQHMTNYYYTLKQMVQTLGIDNQYQINEGI